VRAAVFNGPVSVGVADRPDPVIQEPTDAIVRVVLACVCGSDLWYWRGESPHPVGSIGHEFVGVVEEVGAQVAGVAVGDFVIAPFIFSDMSCPHCLNGSTLSCVRGGNFGNGQIDGGQGEAVRVPLAGSTLVPVPGSGHSDQTLKSLLTLSDVMATGHHAAVSAGVKQGDAVAVVGDGAVGLCAVLAAKRLGAARIIALSRHPGRQKLALEFGATDIVDQRGDPATQAVLELTGDLLPAVVAAQRDDPLRTEPPGRQDGAQADGAVPDHRHRVALLHPGNGRRVVPGRHHVGQGQQRPQRLIGVP